MPPVTTPGLTFGFGLGHGNPPTATTSTIPSMSTATNRSKRQRSVSPSASDDEVDHQQQQQAISAPDHAWTTPQQALPKRLRAGLSVGQTSPGRKLRQGSAPPSSNVATADVGRLLASLDKGSLLTVFSRLLTTDASLAERIRTLIPTPSLASVQASLDEALRVIRSASLNASEMRPEFAWGRLRVPVAEFTTTVTGFLPFFVDRHGEQHHQSGRLDSSPSSGSSFAMREVLHPSTTFSFLQLITERAQSIMSETPPTPENLSASLFSPDATNAVIVAHKSGTPKYILKMYQDALPAEKLTAVNPNVIVSQLVPTLLLHWADFVDAVSSSVNEEGRMFGADTVRGWLSAMEALASSKHGANNNPEKDEERACRASLFALGQRLHEQIGWLVGRHVGWRASPEMEF